MNATYTTVLPVTDAMQAHGIALERALMAEMTDLAQLAANKMKERAPKWKSGLVDAIKADGPEIRGAQYVWEVRPHVMYGLYRELGQRPGRKVPRFDDPKAKDLIDWLRSRAFGGLKRVRTGSARFTARELELRDRYFGLRTFMKRRGLKAQPFVQPTHDEMAVLLPQRMAVVVARFAEGGGAA